MVRRLRQSRLGRGLWVEALEPRQLLASTTFAVIGDFSSDTQTVPTQDVSNLVKSWDPAFVVTAGDNNYPDGEASTIDPNIGQWYHQFIDPYYGSYGSGASDGQNHFWPSLGNHDWNTGTVQPYTDYFTLPNNERYYTVQLGNVALFVIDSDPHEPDGTSSTSTQANWIKSQMLASTATWKLVVFHEPPYSSGYHGDNTTMQWPFKDWGATAVVNGHDHDYERLSENGLTYIVDGLGGESIDGFNATEPGSQIQYNGDYGALKAVATDTTLTFQFIARTGSVIDTYTINAPTPTLPSAPTDLVASVQSTTTARLLWTDASPGVTTSFKIERSSDGVHFTQIATTAAGTTNYLDTGLIPGGSYVYRVRASNSVGNSGYSNTTTASLPAGALTYVSDLTWVTATSGWGPVEKDMSNGSTGAGDGHSITLNGVTYAKGLGAHAVSDITYNLGGAYSFFHSDVGVDDETGAASGDDFQVFADGVLVFDSGGMSQTSITQSINLNVTGVQQLRLHVYDIDGDIDYDHSDWAGAFLTAPADPPTAPGALTAQVLGASQVLLNWSDSTGETGYLIERSTDGKTFTQIGTTSANLTIYADSSIVPSTQYYYRARATNSAGDSGYSNIASVVIPYLPTVPAAPGRLAAAAQPNGQIQLTWVDHSNNETGFKIERSPDGTTNWVLIGAVAANVAVYDDGSGLSPSTTYYYRVRATNYVGDSANSNVASAQTSAGAGNSVFIAAGSVWKYLDNGSNQGTAWRGTSFDDSAWKSGPAQLGYGDGDEVTVVSYGANPGNKYITTYFRDSFTVADPSAVSGLNLKLMRDDGAVVYLNGTEVYRSNMPAGTVSYNTLASAAIGGDDESTWYSASVNPALLIAGTNVVAVEIHQSDVYSTDISFDFQLIATVAPPPAAPAAPTGLTATAASSSQINLNWTDNSNNETGFKIERSPNGTNWTQIALTAAGATQYSDTGLTPQTTYFYRVRAINAAGDSDNTNLASATTQSASGLPSPFVDADIGSVALAGSATYANSTYTIQGAGMDIWNTADGFNFVYGQLSGDGTIVARVTSQTNTQGWAKAGVMIRETLDPGSRQASMVVTPSEGSVFLHRTSPGASTDGDFSSGQAPYWVRLARSGSTFTAAISSDGVTWTTIGTMTINMASNVYIGLIVCSKASALETATFTNVSLTGAISAAMTSNLRASTVVAPVTTVGAHTSRRDLLALLK